MSENRSGKAEGKSGKAEGMSIGYKWEGRGKSEKAEC